MLQSTNDLLNFLVFGIDSYLGPVRDIYFDDSEWIFRYLVIEVSEPEITSHHLISPLSIKEIRWEQKEIHVHLYLDKLRNSPEIDVNLPISRQNEIALRRYYEWPLYWGQAEFFDPPPLPGAHTPTIHFDNDQTNETPPDLFAEDEDYEHMKLEPEDDELIESEFGHSEEDITYSNELRSFLEICGYRIQASDADSSFVTDLIFNSDWTVKYLLLNLGNTFTGELILLTLNWVKEIDWSKSRVIIDLDQQQLNNAPRLVSEQKLTTEYEQKINFYYDSL